MALVKFGAVITDSRGQIGGHQLRMTQYGPVLGMKGSPTKRTTSRRSITRAIFTDFSKRWWSTLTPSQRDDWRALAAANPITNPWGDEYSLTGLAYYIKLNARLTTAGLAPTDDAPGDQAVSSLTSVTLAATAPDSLAITFDPTPVPTDYKLYVFATAAQSPGATNFDRHFFFIGVVDAAETSPFELWPLYSTRLPQLYVGRQYAVSVAMLKTTNAALSPPIQAAAIAT